MEHVFQTSVGDNTAKFTGKADVYAKARPAYPAALLQYLSESAGLSADSVVADIGAGTGILSAQLLEKGATVYAVEPNADMRGQAESKLSRNPHFISVDATAEETTLADNSIDLITVAQAFHWFDGVKFKAECKRILKPTGQVFLIWNARKNDSEFVLENARICQQFCPDFHGFSGGSNFNEESNAAFFDGKMTVKRFSNDLFYERERFINRLLSASYSLQKGDSGYADYVAALSALFDRYAVDGILTLPNETDVYSGRVSC